MANTYPKYYAVNDRPLMVVQMPDATEELFIFDFQTGNLILDRSYFKYLTPGSGKDVDSLTLEQFDRMVVARRVDLLHMWCERMCSLPTGSDADLEELFGMVGKPKPDDILPFSAEKVEIQGDEEAFANGILRLPRGVLKRADLEKRFGPGTVVPKVQPAFPHRFSYRVKVPGAPHVCSLFVSTPSDDPGPNADVITLTLRMDRDHGLRDTN